MTRIDRLDALRGIAALLVVWQHTSESFVKLPDVAARGAWPAEVAWSVDFGRIGVVCFFLISGFIIPHSFSVGPGAVQKFATRRFFRLYPVYWFSVLLAVFTGAVLAGKHWNYSEIAANLTMLQSMLGISHIQGLYWTLQVELIFYIACGLLFYMGKMHDTRFLVLLAVAFLSLFVGLVMLERWLGYATGLSLEQQYIPYFLAIMFCGTILRDMLFGEHSIGEKIFFLMAPSAVFGIPGSVLLLHFFGINIGDEPVRFGGAHLIGLGIFCLAIQLRWKVPGFLAWMGVISYSIYLFHPVAMKLVGWMYRQPWAGFTAEWALWALMAVATLITLLIATTTYYLIERPAIGLGRQLSLSVTPPKVALA